MPMPPFPSIRSRDALMAWEEDLRPDTDLVVSKQHMVSATLLKRFHDPNRHRLARLNVRHPESNEKLTKADRVGNFPLLTYATASAERLWQGIEDNLPEALFAADSGSALTDDAHQATILGVVALHLARNKRYSAISEESWRELVARERALFLSDPYRMNMLRREYYRRYGLHSGGPTALAALYDEAIAEQVRDQMPARLARLQVQVKFFQFLFWLPAASLQLVTPLKGEFLIGDSPAIFYDAVHQLYGGVWQLGQRNATHIAMPLGPRLTVVMVLDGCGRLESGTVDERSLRAMNEMQVRTAVEYVFYRPGEESREFVREILRQQDTLVAS